MSRYTKIVMSQCMHMWLGADWADLSRFRSEPRSTEVHNDNGQMKPPCGWDVGNFSLTWTSPKTKSQ